jgi:hypothetical protein
MSVLQITNRLSRPYLDRKTKADLIDLVMMLVDISVKAEDENALLRHELDTIKSSNMGGQVRG